MNLDEATIKKAQQGDVPAFSAVIDASYEMLFRVAIKCVGNREDAEDVTQQVCIKLGTSLRQYRFDSSFSSWLYRIVVNCANDWYRSEKRHQHSDTASQPESGGRDESAHHQVYLQQVLQQIERWGGGYLDAVVLVIGEGMTHAEAAAVLEVSESTISWRIHEVRKRLVSIDSGRQV